jgi:hypothetical protein
MQYKTTTATSHARARVVVFNIFNIFRLSKTLSYQGLSASIDDKINVCDDKINVCDDKINVCDDKLNICDDKINSNNLERQNKHKG